jgi:hypothetical protein
MEYFGSRYQRRQQSRPWSVAIKLVVSSIFAHIGLVAGQQQCYFGPGAEFRGPQNLVPCNSTGTSTCCLLGDTCLSGNSCYDYNTGDLYQYGCTDIEYQDPSCPQKCGWDPCKLCSLMLLNSTTAMFHANLRQPCRHGRLWSIVSISQTLVTLGSAMLRKAVAANGIPPTICWCCNP